MSFMADHLINEARRRQVRLWVDVDGELRFTAGDGAAHDRLFHLLRSQAGQIAARITAGGASWFKSLSTATADAPLVYVIPAAGASPSTYRAWGEFGHGRLRVEAVLTPGREERFQEGPFTNIAPLADRLTEQILGHADRPFAVFGHSYGALVAREVTRRLARSTDQQLALFVAGSPPPDQVSPGAGSESDDELLSMLHGWQGTPPELLEDPDFLRLFLPALRADLKVYSSARADLDPSQPVPVPLVALAGRQDDTAALDQFLIWQAWTTKDYSAHVVEGGHFFPVTAASEVVDIVVRTLLVNR